MTTFFNPSLRARLVSGFLAASLAAGGCGGGPAADAAQEAQAPVSSALKGGGFTPEGFLLSLAEGLINGMIEEGIFGDPIDYARIDQMIKDDLKQFAQDEAIKKAVDDIVATTQSLRTVVSGRSSDTKHGTDPADVALLEGMWAALDKDLTSVSRVEEIRRAGFPSYLFGATVQHAVFQELQAADPERADKYEGQLRQALHDHLAYVKERLRILEQAHADRLAKITGLNPQYWHPKDEACEEGLWDPNRYYYYDAGAEDGNDPYMPKNEDHPNDPHAGGSPYDYGEGPWGLGGGVMFHRAWELYNAQPGAKERCRIARGNYTRDLKQKLEDGDHLQEARSLVQQWEQALDQLDRDALKPLTAAR